MFQSSSKENISPITPRPYQPGCNISFEQWQRSEDNRMKALSIQKSKFEDQVRPAFGSPYATNMSSDAIDHEVQRRLELVRRSSVEQEIKRRVQHEMQMASCHAAMPYHSPANECEKRDELFGMISMFLVVVFSAQQVMLHWGAWGKRNMHQVRIDLLLELVVLDFLLRPNPTLLLRFAAFASVHCPL